MTEEKRKQWDELIAYLRTAQEYYQLAELDQADITLILDLLKEIGVTEPEKEIE